MDPGLALSALAIVIAIAPPALRFGIYYFYDTGLEIDLITQNHVPWKDEDLTNEIKYSDLYLPGEIDFSNLEVDTWTQPSIQFNHMKAVHLEIERVEYHITEPWEFRGNIDPLVNTEVGHKYSYYTEGFTLPPSNTRTSPFPLRPKPEEATLKIKVHPKIGSDQILPIDYFSPFELEPIEEEYQITTDQQIDS